MSENAISGAGPLVQAQVCELHHFVWTWPIEGGSGSVGVCDLCGAVTTGERDVAMRAEALEQAADDLAARLDTFPQQGRHTRARWAEQMLRDWAAAMGGAQ